MLSARPTPAVAGAYLAGSTLGAFIPAVLLVVASGLFSPIPLSVRAIVVVSGLIGLAARSFGLVSYRLPQNARQIPEFIFAAPPRRAAFRFAFELGTAMRTFVTAEAPYAAALTAAFLFPRTLPGGIGAATLLAIGFALGRSQVVMGQVVRSSIITRPVAFALRSANTLALLGCAMAVVFALGS